MKNELANLALETKNVIFLTELIDPNIPAIQHYVYGREKRNGGQVFVVQLSISGTQRELGEFSEIEPALRFADMATLRFKRYRKRSTYNFSEAQAIADTNNTEENGGVLAGYILSRQENL